jgi:diaminopimelate epimerase
MSTLSFVKYQGAGNDFILIDDRALHFDPTRVPTLCHRKYGIGADGVILLQNDLRMRIFNSDGTEAESCGNGLCCLMQFLLHLGLPKKRYSIATGTRRVEVEFEGDLVSVNMGKPTNVKQLYICGNEVHSLDTGVPHAVVFVADVQAVDLAHAGASLRHHALFQPRGTNVNFAALQSDGSVQVRTYERGLEGESLACGTGAAAVGVIGSHIYRLPNPIQIRFPGGNIDIYVTDEVRMVGKAVRVFEGTV